MRVLLADDHSLVREGLAMMVRAFLPHSLVCQVGSWTEAREQVQQASFELALLDLAMPGCDAWDKELAALLTSVPSLPVCVISGTELRTHLQVAFDLGVRGYILKTATADEMHKALQQVLAGKTYFPPQAWSIGNQNEDTSGTTLRQREVLGLLAEGLSNKEIGIQLALSEGTVKRHVYNIFRALQAKNRTDAVQRARQLGVVTN